MSFIWPTNLGLIPGITWFLNSVWPLEFGGGVVGRESLAMGGPTPHPRVLTLNSLQSNHQEELLEFPEHHFGMPHSKINSLNKKWLGEGVGALDFRFQMHSNCCIPDVYN